MSEPFYTGLVEGPSVPAHLPHKSTMTAYKATVLEVVEPSKEPNIQQSASGEKEATYRVGSPEGAAGTGGADKEQGAEAGTDAQAGPGAGNREGRSARMLQWLQFVTSLGCLGSQSSRLARRPRRPRRARRARRASTTVV